MCFASFAIFAKPFYWLCKYKILLKKRIVKIFEKNICIVLFFVL